MAYTSVFQFAPAEWLPIRDQKLLDEIADKNLMEHQGKVYEHPNFDFQVVWDVHNYFVTDLFQRIRLSDINNQKLVLLLPSPENAVFISLSDVLNKYDISCRNVHVFFLYEYANEKGEVAPWQSPYSRSGHFMRYFYQRLHAHLRMPLEQIHFWNKENAESYSDMIAAQGGLDVAYTTLNWAGGIAAFDADNYSADTMDELLAMGSRYVPLPLETGAMDSLRGMFGCSGDVSNVPPYAVTVGPKDIVSAKYCMHMQYLSSCGGDPSYQKFPLRLALLGPIDPKNPACIMRLAPGTCFATPDVASVAPYCADHEWLLDKLAEIRMKEEN